MDRLKETGSVIEFDNMSLDEFLIHLFIRDADSQMARNALEVLERDKPNIHMLVNKIKETESAVWYNNKKGIWSDGEYETPPNAANPVSLSAGVNARTVANVIIKVSTADTKK